MRSKSQFLPFGNADAVTTSSEEEFASVLRQFKRPVADFAFTGTSRRAMATGLNIGELVATAAFADPMHVKCDVDPQVAFTLPLSGSGKIIQGSTTLDWAAGKTIVGNSFDQPLEVSTSSSGTLISLRPCAGKLLAVLRSLIRERSGKDGAEADAIMARLLVRGPFIDTGRSWTVDYFSAIMNVVALFDDCKGDSATLTRIGIEDVLNRLLAKLILDQEHGAAESEPSNGLPRSTRAVDLICDRVRNTIGSPMSISDMEEMTGLTGRALNYAFRARFDCSPQEWQRNFLLDHARRLLRGSDYTGSVKALAYELGFASPSSFSAFYRQRFGERPSETLSGGSRWVASPDVEDSPPAEE